MAAEASGWVDEMLAELTPIPALDISANPTGTGFSSVLGRMVRTGDWEDQSISTYTKIREALEAGHMAAAAEMVDTFFDEASVIYGFFRQLIPDAIQHLAELGDGREELREINRMILALLNLEDGRPFNARFLWEEFRSTRRAMLLDCGASNAPAAIALLWEYKEQWRRIQDRDVDHLYGLITELVNRHGEAALGTFWESIIGPLFDVRYAKFDIKAFPWEDSLETNLYLAFESMRGHLVGPNRLGDMEFEETEKRFTFRFDPCGSGGRAFRGDTEVEGTPPRTGAPYQFGVTKEEHDFAWNKKGVCLYCSNCCIVLQLKPIDAFGYPVRVVEPPTIDDPEAKCTWHVYKDPADTPEEAYTAVGRTKPKQLSPQHGLSSTEVNGS